MSTEERIEARSSVEAHQNAKGDLALTAKVMPPPTRRKPSGTRYSSSTRPSPPCASSTASPPTLTESAPICQGTEPRTCRGLRDALWRDRRSSQVS